jgi:hypothetical protein
MSRLVGRPTRRELNPVLRARLHAFGELPPITLVVSLCDPLLRPQVAL